MVQSSLEKSRAKPEHGWRRLQVDNLEGNGVYELTKNLANDLPVARFVICASAHQAANEVLIHEMRCTLVLQADIPCVPSYES